MSIDKWLSKDNLEREEIKPKKGFNAEELQEGKKKIINGLLGNKSDKINRNNDSEPFEVHSSDFFSYFLQFKDWLDKRIYLKGDLDKIEIWILNLSKKLRSESEFTLESENKLKKTDLMEDFRALPPKLIEEKMRIAINKKLRNVKMTSSDIYYLKKLKKIVEEKLKEAHYYEMLKKILL